MTIAKDLSPYFPARNATFGALARPGLRALLEEEKKEGDGGGGNAVDPRDAKIADLTAKLAASQKVLDDAKAADDKKVADAKAADDKKKADDLDALKKAGDSNKLADALVAQLADERKQREDLAKQVAELTPHAAAGKAAVEARALAVKAALEKLPPDKKAIIEAAPEGMRETLITAFGGTVSAPAAAAALPPGGGPPPLDGTIDFAAALAGGEKTWLEAKKRDEKGATAWFQKTTNAAGANGATAPLSLLQRPAPQQQQK